MVWNREPVLFMAVIQVVVVLLLAFGVELSKNQEHAIMAVAAAVLGLVARRKVSPVT